MTALCLRNNKCVIASVSLSRRARLGCNLHCDTISDKPSWPQAGSVSIGFGLRDQDLGSASAALTGSTVGEKHVCTGSISRRGDVNGHVSSASRIRNEYDLLYIL